jgi:hypothetical protein
MEPSEKPERPPAQPRVNPNAAQGVFIKAAALTADDLRSKLYALNPILRTRRP